MNVKKMTANLKVTHYNSGDASGAGKALGWVDMRDFGGILVSVLSAVLVGVGVTAFKLVANTKSDGTGTSADIKTHALGSAPDAAGDYLFLEATAEEIRALGPDFRYVSARITTANAGDKIVATYVRGAPRFAYEGLTADQVA